jgi:hypothetical protein
MEAVPLIEDLIKAMRLAGYAREADELQELLGKLIGGSPGERQEAAHTIAANCHIKYYGDLNLDMPGEGSYPLWNHLSRVKDALSAL